LTLILNKYNILVKESKIVDVFTVKVVKGIEGRGVSGLAVGLRLVEIIKIDDPFWGSHWVFTDKNGFANFHNLSPGNYQIDYPSDCEEKNFRVRAQGIKVYVEVSANSCDRRILITPKN